MLVRLFTNVFRIYSQGSVLKAKKLFYFYKTYGEIWLPNGFALCPEKFNKADIQLSIAEVWLEFSIVNKVHVSSKHMAPISDLWGGDGI